MHDHAGARLREDVKNGFNAGNVHRQCIAATVARSKKVLFVIPGCENHLVPHLAEPPAEALAQKARAARDQNPFHPFSPRMEAQQAPTSRTSGRGAINRPPDLRNACSSRTISAS